MQGGRKIEIVTVYKSVDIVSNQAKYPKYDLFARNLSESAMYSFHLSDAVEPSNDTPSRKERRKNPSLMKLN